MLASDILRRLNAVCPCVGVSIGIMSDKATWLAQPAATATPAQLAALPAAIAAIDITKPTADEALESMPFTTTELAALFEVVAGNAPAWAMAIVSKAVAARQAAVGANVPQNQQ